MNFKLEDKAHISKETFKLLPRGLCAIGQIESAQDRDIYLLSAIVGLSVCMPGTTAKYRDGQIIGPHHYFYVVGPPQSSKSAVNLARTITSEVNDRIHSAFLQELEAYEMEEDSVNKGALPEIRKLFASADTTSAAFVRSLVNQHSAGSLLVSPEAGMLASSLGKEHGGFLGQLLSAWGHEEIDKDLVQYNRYSSCKFPKLSMALASNVQDFKNFLGKASSSGLLSRFIMYTSKHLNKPVDLVGSFDCTELFAPLKKDSLGMFDFFSDNPVKFELRGDQIAVLENLIDSLKKEMNRLNPSVVFGIYRFAMSLYRQLMTISVYRHFCDRRSGNFVIPTDEDLLVVTDLAYVQANHLLSIYEMLPTLKHSIASVYDILRGMDETFKSGDFIQELVNRGLSFYTARRRLANLKTTEHVYETAKRGWLSKKPPKN